MTSAADAFGALALATTMKDFRAGSADLAALYVHRLDAEIGSLKAQVSDLTNDCKTLNNLFHTSDKKAAVLATRLEWAQTQLQAQNNLDWIFDVLFALVLIPPEATLTKATVPACKLGGSRTATLPIDQLTSIAGSGTDRPRGI